MVRCLRIRRFVLHQLLDRRIDPTNRQGIKTLGPELPAALTVAPEMPAPAESFTEPEIRPPVVAALGRIVRGPEDGPAPTATARRAEPTISDVTALVDWMARQRPTTRKGRGREAGPPRWRSGVFTQGVSAEKSSQTN